MGAPDGYGVVVGPGVTGVTPELQAAASHAATQVAATRR